MATSKRSRRPAAAAQPTSVAPSGEMPAATREKDDALVAGMRSAAAERERLDPAHGVVELADDPRLDESAPRATPRRQRNTKSTRAKAASSEEATAGLESAAHASARDETVPTSERPEVMRLNDALASARSDAARDMLKAAGERAFRRDEDRTPSIGLILILQGAIATGLRMPPGTESSPRWLVEFAIDRGASPERILSYSAQPREWPNVGIFRVRRAAATAIRMARALASATIGEPRFEARHLILAILDHTDRETSEQVQQDFLAAGLDLAAFRDDLLRRILAKPAHDENVQVWQRLRDDPATAWLSIVPASGATARSRTDTVPGFHADRVAASGSDPLGIDADVTAFARLICLEEARPPLSIGIFGEWGSGKSSFMERLQIRIADLTREAREKVTASAPAQPAAAAEDRSAATNAPRFVENVVQIRFNAWHYADANLWASLTAEFFDQLRRGGYEGQRSSDYLALIGKVAERVRSLEASAQKAEDKLADAERAARHADEALASARRKLAASDLALASEQLSKQFEAIRTDKDNRAKLQEVGRRLYRDDLAAELDGFTATVTEAASWPGKLALVGKLVAGGGKERVLAMLAIVLVAFAGIGWQIVDETSAAVAGGRLIAWAGAAFAGFQALAGALKLARPVLDGAWEYAKAVEKARKELVKEVEDKEVAARDAARTLAEAQQKAQDAKAPLARYGDGAAAGAPSTILRYFLFEDGDVRDYDKQVGLVSRARRSFEQLDAIFAAKRDGMAAKQKLEQLQPGEALDPDEIKALERFEAMELDKQGLHIPDRIVLYIDDLDRCTHQQVYDVLQAIHLLLAFELFVVVVGVDVRWIEEAVARQFAVTAADLPDNATAAEREAARHKAEIERRKRAIDYLEKIFQLPFWLRRLSTEGRDGGSYGAYVQELLRANLGVAEDAQSPLAGTSSEPQRKGFAPDGKREDDARGTGEPVFESLGDTTAAADDLGSVELALATVRLTKEEVDFLASPEIGAIAFKSPRSVKRMLNVYRIVRARMSEAELDEFLGRNGNAPNWPIAVFLAAVETGQTVDVADMLYEGMKTAEPHEIFATASLEAIVAKGRVSAQGQSGTSKIMAANEISGHVLSPGVYALNGQRGHPEMNASWAKCGAAFAMARIVRRYSFNRYH